MPELVLDELARARRGVVVLGVDGLGFRPAVSAFRGASILRLTGTVPTTSATGWLTALTGLSAIEHGVPGMVYRVGDALVYAVTGEVIAGSSPGAEPLVRPVTTMFERSGVRCLSIGRELAHLPGPWARALLQGTEPVGSVSSAELARQAADPGLLVEAVIAQVSEAVQLTNSPAQRANSPASAANSAAEAANSAAGAANSGAGVAAPAVEAANPAAGAANSAAVSAKSAVEAANSAVVAVNSAAGDTNSPAPSANSAAEAADTSAKTADTRADAADTRAESADTPANSPALSAHSAVDAANSGAGAASSGVMGGGLVGRVVVWGYVNLDEYLHGVGVDSGVMGALGMLDRAAGAWAREGWTVVVHSDHGQTRVRADPGLCEGWRRLEDDCELPGGGAGRMRWLYPRAGREDVVRRKAARLLGEVAEVVTPEALGLERGRVGAVVAVARDERFPIPDPSMRFEHGGLSEDELAIPFAVWRA